jgi:opacity protein-like surface antigen
MRPTSFVFGAASFALLLSSSAANAQSIHLTPLFGSFHPSSSFFDVRGAAHDGNLVQDRALGLGMNVELSFLRGSIAYATGARITEDGVDSGNDIGNGSLLALAADVVFRPIPRLVFIQPYVVAGAGLKREHYSFDDNASAVLPESETESAWHLGLGADVMLGKFGLVAEVSDFITRDDNGITFGRHDSFAMLGLRFRVF